MGSCKSERLEPWGFHDLRRCGPRRKNAKSYSGILISKQTNLTNPPELSAASANDVTKSVLSMRRLLSATGHPFSPSFLEGLLTGMSVIYIYSQLTTDFFFFTWD